ncbi:MAG: esterase/lipase family protein [Propionibacteriaceae bacterium]
MHQKRPDPGPDDEPRGTRWAATLPRLAAAMPRVVSGIALEAGWMTAHLVLYPLGALSERGVLSRKEHTRHDLAGLNPNQRGLVHHDVLAAGTPILLVHGIVDNHSIFAVLERALRRRGFNSLTTFEYGLLTSDIRETADRLAEAIEQLCAETGYEQIHVIGHSLGGLISRYYVQRLGGAERVHTLVTLGTPHQGTLLARMGAVLPLVRQLAPGSDLLAELSEPAPECATRFIAFHSDMDQLIVPSRNAVLDHPDLAATNIAIKGVGHLSLVSKGDVAFRIAAALSHLDGDEEGSLWTPDEAEPERC